MLLLKLAVCNSEKTEFIKQQEVSGLLSSLRLRRPKLNSISRSFFVLIVINKLMQGKK